MSAFFVELAFRPPLSTSTAPLFAHTFNDPMTLLVSEVFSQAPTAFFVTFAGIFALALFTPIAQSVLVFASFVELTLVFPLIAPAALLHFYPLNICFAFDFASSMNTNSTLQRRKCQYCPAFFSCLSDEALFNQSGFDILYHERKAPKIAGFL